MVVVVVEASMVVVVELVGHMVPCTVLVHDVHPPKTHYLLISNCAHFYHPHVLTLSHSWAHKRFLHPEGRLQKPQSRNLSVTGLFFKDLGGTLPK